MHRFVINLDRRPERYAEFCEHNAHIGAKRFSAIDGCDPANKNIIEDWHRRLPDYSPSNIANAESHINLWKLCADGNEEFLIIEDDAIFSKGDHNWGVASNSGMTIWGFNFNAPLVMDIGSSPALIQLDQNTMRLFLSGGKGFATLGHACISLVYCFGTPAYTITPETARSLLKELPPLINDIPFPMPELQKVQINTGIDCILNKLYRKVRATVTFPPLVLTPNFPFLSS